MNAAKPLRHLAAVRVSNVDKKSVEGQVPVRLCNYTDVYYGDRITPALDLMAATASPEQVRAFRLLPGDVIITKDSEDPSDIGVPAFVEHSAPDLVCGYHLAVLRPFAGQADGRYLYWAMASRSIRSYLSASATGITRYGLRTDSIASTPIPWWPVTRQQAIADFLDGETTRIDALIAKKRRLIGVLDERVRQARIEITRRGLNASVLLRESGLPWVGLIPAHWTVVPCRALLKLRRSLVGAKSSEYTLLSLTRRGVIVRDTSENFGKFPASFDTYQAVDPDDLVFCLFDIPETPRTVGIARQRGMVTGAYSVFRASDPILSAYLAHLYCGYDDEKSLSLFYTGLRKVIRTDTFLGMRVPLPPPDEMRAIVEYQDHLQESTRAATDKLSRQIGLLTEHRQALITAAVMGEVTVPEVAV